jgi:hypothetical protein
MHGPINVKSPNNTSKWRMGFISAFKGLIYALKKFRKIFRVNLLGPGPRLMKKEFTGPSSYEKRIYRALVL